MNYQDLFTGCATLLFLALFIVAAVPQLSRRMANFWLAHSEAMIVFWAWQATAFRAYGVEFRKVHRAAGEELES
jgi:hypothetical protein